MEYVEAAANLYGQIYGIEGTRDRDSIRKILANVHVPPFTPKSSVKIHVTDKELQEDKEKGGGDAGELSSSVLPFVSSLSFTSLSLYQKKLSWRS